MHRVCTILTICKSQHITNRRIFWLSIKNSNNHCIEFWCFIFSPYLSMLSLYYFIQDFLMKFHFSQKKCITFAILTIFCLQNFLWGIRFFDQQADASWIQNNSAWFTTIDFRNNLAGISAWSNYIHNPSGIGTITSAGGAADFTTADSIPPSFSGWTNYTIDYTGTAPSYEIQECNGNVITSNTYNGTVDLTDPIYAGYNCLQSRVQFDETTTIDNVTFSRSPKPVASIELSSVNPTINAGQCNTYKVRRSMSYYSNPNTAVYATLPYLSGSDSFGFDMNTIDPNVNQFPFSNLVTNNITNGGILYTGDAPLTLSNGLEIPPHSIYRLPTNAANWSTYVYQFQLCSDKGTQNHVQYDMIAGIQWQNTSIKTTNPLQTTISSQAQAKSSCTTDKQYVFSSIPGSKVVTYTTTLSHDSSSTEDIFSPTATIDMDNIITHLMNDCSLSESNAIARIWLPSGFSLLSAGVHQSSYIFPNNSILYAPNNYYFSTQAPTQYSRNFSVDYAWCTASFASVSTTSVWWSNASTSSATCTVNHEYTVPANANVGDFVWYDANNDGTQNNGEIGVWGVWVELRYCSSNPLLDNQLVATGVSDSNGNYAFTNLAIWDYKVVFTLPDPNTTGYQRTTTNWNATSGSDAGAGWASTCFSLTANQTQADIDAGLIIPTPGGGSGGEPGWYNKCMYTTTTDEYRYGAGWSAYDTNREWIASNTNGFYDNDCLNTDAYSPVTTVEVNATGETFYHLNYHGDTMGLVSQSYVKTGVWSVDRVDPQYLIQWVDIWTNSNGRALDNTTPRAKRFCHTSTSLTMPTINMWVLDGSTTPTAAALGTGWSDTCDNNSHWVISAMQCLNSAQNPASAWTLCDWSPSRYQYRIRVTPNQAQNLTCGWTATKVSVDNTSDVYMQSSLLWKVSQTSDITNTPLSSLVTNSDITSSFYGPVSNPLPINTTGHIIYLRQNFSTQTVSGNVSIQLSPAWGFCPSILSSLASGFSYDNSTCQITGPIPEAPLASTGSQVCQFVQTDTFTCADVPGNSDETQREQVIYRPWILDDSQVFEKLWWPNCSINSDYKNETDLTSRGAPLEIRYYHGWSSTPSDKAEFDYDSNQNRTEMRRLNRDGSNWIVNNKEEYGYTWSNLLWEKRIFYRNGSALQLYTRYVFSYDSNGNMQEYIYYSRNGVSLALSSKYEYDYDTAGNIIERRDYYRNWSSWNIWEIYEYGYNNTNKMISKSYQYRNGSSLVPGQSTTFIYDSNGNQVEQNISHAWCTAPDGICSKIEYDYDNNNKVIEAREYSRNGSSLQFSQKIIYGYSSAGNLITRTYYNAQCVKIPPIAAAQYLELPFDILYTQWADGDNISLSASTNAYSTCSTFTTPTNTPLTLTTTIPTPPDPIDPPFFNPPLSTPHLITNKYLDKEMIWPNGDITYTIQISNVGDAWATNVYLIDPLAAGLQFLSATTSGWSIPSTTTNGYNTTQALSGSTYHCPIYNGVLCSVFETASTLNPSLPDPNNAYTSNTIQQNFSQMNDNWDGTRSSTIGSPTAVAYLIPTLLPGQMASLQLKVKNVGNVRWDVIANNVATIADQVIQSVSNIVYTTILPNDPNSINGTIYRDTDSSYNYLSGTDSTLSGVIVYLYDENGTLVATTQTDSQGYFIFENLVDGNYIIVYDPGTVTSANNPSIGSEHLEPSSSAAGFILNDKGDPEFIGNPETFTKITKISLWKWQNHQNNYFWLSSVQAYDLAINKEYNGITPVLVWSTGTYTITVSNTGNLDANDVYINEYLPTGIRVINEELPVDITNSNNATEWVINYHSDLIPAGETRQIILHVEFLTAGDMLNTVDVYSKWSTELINPYNGYWSFDPMSLLTTVDPINGQWSLLPVSTYWAPDYVPGSNNVDATFFTVADAPTPNTLWGTIYDDIDNSSGYTNNESGFESIVVTLRSWSDIIATTTTNSSGNYFFGNIPDGSYNVSYNSTSISWYIPSIANIGTVNSVSVGTSSGATMITDIILSAGVSSIDNNFGLTQQAIVVPPVIILSTLSGTVYTETGWAVEGITIYLYNWSGNLISSTPTNINGEYIFINLWSGSYSIAHQNMSGYTNISSSAGTISGIRVGLGSLQWNTDIAAISSIILSNGSHSINNNFVLQRIPSIVVPNNTGTLPSWFGGGCSNCWSSTPPLLSINPIIATPVPSNPLVTSDYYSPTFKTILRKNPLRSAIGSLNFTLPTELLKTGTPVDALRAKWIDVVRSQWVLVDQYDWITINSKKRYASHTGLSYRLKKMPQQTYKNDKSASIYVVIPRLGVVAPIRDIPSDHKDFTTLINWWSIQANNWLQNGVLHYPMSGLPGEVGNMVLFGHSSYYDKDPGRYKTIFTSIGLLKSGDEIWIYKKKTPSDKKESKDEQYERIIYDVSSSYLTSAKDVSVLKPKTWATLSLVTCAPIGTARDRIIVEAIIRAPEYIEVTVPVRHIKTHTKKKS